MSIICTEEEKQKLHEEDLKRVSEFRLMDDTFMRVVLKNNLKVAQYILRVVTGLSDLELISEKTQEDMKRVTGARSICLDVYGSDASGRKYDLEIQKANTGARPKRARYHSSILDIENLDANQTFEELPETYTIFITEHDVFDEGRPYYLFNRYEHSTGKLFPDDEHILYVNGDYQKDDEIGRLMHDFKCKEPDDMYNKDLADCARYYKKTEKGVTEMCQIMEDMREETEKRTEKATTMTNLKNLMDSLGLSLEQAMDALKIPKYEQDEFRSAMKQ